jgi:hypothetical protein
MYRFPILTTHPAEHILVIVLQRLVSANLFKAHDRRKKLESDILQVLKAVKLSVLFCETYR